MSAIKNGRIAKYKTATNLFVFLTVRLVLRVAADDPLGAYPFGHKFGCSLEDGRRLLELCKQLGLHVIGVWCVVYEISHFRYNLLIATYACIRTIKVNLLVYCFTIKVGLLTC